MIFAEPSKDTPPIVLAFCNTVAEEALPDRAPTNVVAVTTPAMLTLSKSV